MKHKKEKRHSEWYELLISCGLFLLGGILFGYLLFNNLDYQEEAAWPSHEGYRLSKEEIIQIPMLISESAGDDEGISVNPNYQEEYLETLLKEKTNGIGISYPNSKPVFQLVDIGNGQTVYRITAELSSLRQIDSVQFPVWGEQNGQNDLQLYDAVYDAETKKWQSDILVENHQEAGSYYADIIVNKKSGRIEQTELGKFKVDKPSITAELDPTRTDKGQFDVRVTVDSKAPVAEIKVSVWSKEDQSDLRWYEGKRQDDETYQVRMDYEDFDFSNGVYTAEAYLTSANGLQAHAAAGTAEINMNYPVRIRVQGDTALFKDRQLTNEIKKVSSNSMAYIKGIVYNSEQKIYRTDSGYIPADGLQVNEMMEDIRYVAHRGNHQAAPENSIPSFEQADTWGVETDIRLTKDKKWVVMHDGTIDRMTNGKGNISDLTLEQIRSYRIISGSNVSTYSQEQLVVPTLEEFLSIMGSKQGIPFIEIKTEKVAAADYDHLTQLIDQYGFSERGVVISFNYENLKEMKSRLPQLQVQLLSENLNVKMIEEAAALGVNAGLDIKYNPAVSTADLIAKAQQKGLSVNLWGVPRDKFPQMEALGIDNLTTDFD
ncbi:glycerophosphodiester phosphodiesterase family protein [Enterococcus sp. LJL51]|uniref:glycerophosphodiester phosphodiesterase family protein n=1 Tax=Enterococcus sp. LJL51 TaxID=3416656 RepID=UPI003CEEAB61